MRLTACLLALAWLLPGCRDTCSAHTMGCGDGTCEAEWDCGDDLRSIRVTAEGCECIEGGASRPGSCGPDVCNIMGDASAGAIAEGDDAFEALDDEVNAACDWNIRTVEPLVIGACN